MSAIGPLPELGAPGTPLHGEPLRGFKLGPSRGLPPLKFPLGRVPRRRVRPPFGERPHGRPVSAPQRPAPTVVVQAAPRSVPAPESAGPEPASAGAIPRRESPARERHAAMLEVLGRRRGRWEAHLPHGTRGLIRTSVRQHVAELEAEYEQAGHERLRERLRERREQWQTSRRGMTPKQRQRVRQNAQAIREILDSMESDKK